MASMTPSRSAPVEIRPTSGWIGLGAVEPWKHRDLAYFLVWRDLAATLAILVGGLGYFRRVERTFADTI
jgi:hypothetical protein